MEPGLGYDPQVYAVHARWRAWFVGLGLRGLGRRGVGFRG